jgi:cell division protein ZapA
MGKLSIKIVIAGRNYPLTINAGEEEVVRKAVEDINTSVQRLQESYAVKDMQDLLAMTSLQLATRSNTPSGNEKEGELKNEVLSALQLLSHSIEE